MLTVQLGGLGDVVLTSELIAGLRARYPEERITLACRREFVLVADLFPTRPDSIVGVDVNPHVIDRPSQDLRRALENVAQQFQGLQTRVLIEGSLRPTWLTRFLVALLKPELSVCCGLPEEPETVLQAALKWFRLQRQELVELALPPDINERNRYGLLLDYLEVPRVSQQSWRLAAQQEADAVRWLESRSLAAGSYVVCFPGADVNVSVKRWPAPNFARAIDSLRRQGYSVLLLGSSAEEKELADIADALEGERVPVFCGNKTNLLLAIAIVSKAKAYLGNDTGPMHVAQAFGVPGVAIFSGGFWPRYAPWAAGSVAMVHPLPCFGCSYDCFLGRGLCVESIPVDAVVTALLEVLTGSPTEPIRSVQTVNPDLIPILANASARFRALQHDRAERLRAILLLDSEVERLRGLGLG